ncbi:hypothetical protein TWF718_007876 [Orbilia javanica]|uniref:Uncharacterized protein n=1 Tax=Orbilia javanica TaxID=47235 RepID=A0AAN8NTA0_9PEZI
MKLLALFILAASITPIISAEPPPPPKTWETVDLRDRRGVNPRDVIRGLIAEGYGTWPIVVYCGYAKMYWSGKAKWSIAYLHPSLLEQRKCEIFWCAPDSYCFFKSGFPGWTDNWWYMNWQRNGKELCYRLDELAATANWTTITGGRQPCTEE